MPSTLTYATREVSSPDQLEIIAESRVVSGAELGVGLALVAFGTLPLFGIWWFLKGMQFQLDNFIALTFLGTYVFAVIETFAVILLWGLGRLSLPSTFVPWLGGATIGEIAGLLLLVVKKVFA